MIRVLQINAGELFGGVSSMVFNFYQNINREKVQFDFVAPNKSSYENCRSQIEQMGGRIIELKATGSLISRKFRFWRRLFQLIKKEKYEVVHINSGSITFNLQVAWIAKLSGCKKIIVHSHNAGNDSSKKAFVMKLIKPLLELGPTHYFACSHKAAQFMFISGRIKKGEYQVINNGVNLERFQFDIKNREAYRQQLELNEKKVLLHVGRFCKQKNHRYLIDIFNAFQKRVPNSVLLLVGEGELFEEVKIQVRNYGLDNLVIFLGLRNDIDKLMSASDIFILPSLFEGLPVVGVEAQASGLPCIFADTITSEADLTDSVRFLPINVNEDKWVKELIDLTENSGTERILYAEQVASKGYSLSGIAKMLEDVYLA